MAMSLEQIGAQLKSAIELIQENFHLTRDITGLDAQDEANVTFANPALLPETITPAEDMEFIDPANSPYPDKALKALWIIADIVNKNDSISARNTLKTCFLYLDNTQYVPQIIDEKTYQAGIAMYAALEQIKVTWVLETAANAFLRKPVKELLLDMKNTLKSRLMRYEAHGTPERLEETLHRLKINQELSELAQQQDALPLDDRSHIITLYQEIKTHIESPDLSSIATSRLIQDRETQLQKIRERVTSYEQFNAPRKNKLPNETSIIHHSRYALMVADSQPEAITNEWYDLLTPSCIMIDTPVTPQVTSLIKTYKEKTAPLMHALQLQIELLHRYAETIPALTLPTWLQRDPTTHVLTYVLTESTNPDQRIRQEENACIYQRLIDELRAYEKIVLEQCQRMRNNPMLAEQLDSSPQTEELFVQINLNIENQLEQLRRLQTQAIRMASDYAASIEQDQSLTSNRTKNKIDFCKGQIKRYSKKITQFQENAIHYQQVVLSLRAEKIQYLGQMLDMSQKLIENLSQNNPITDEDFEHLHILFTNEPSITHLIDALSKQRQQVLAAQALAAQKAAAEQEASAAEALHAVDTTPFHIPPIDSTKTAALVAAKAAAQAATNVSIWGKKMGKVIKTQAAQAAQAVQVAQESYAHKQPALHVAPLQELCIQLKTKITSIEIEKKAIDTHQEPTQPFQTNEEYMRLHRVFQTTTTELDLALQTIPHLEEQKHIFSQQLSQASLQHVLILYEKLLSTPATRRDYTHQHELSDIESALEEVSRLVNALNRAHLSIENHFQKVQNPNELDFLPSNEKAILLIDYQELLDKKASLNEKYFYWKNVLRDLEEKKQAILDAIDRARREEAELTAAQHAEESDEESNEEVESSSFSSDNSSIVSISMEDEQISSNTPPHAPKNQVIPAHIRQRFFAPNTGLLRQYDAHFSWHDFFAEIAHLFLSCFVNYRTEKSKQHDFITELDQAQDLSELKEKAQNGQKIFHLKSIHLKGEPNINSLDSLVSDLLNKIEPDNNTQADDTVFDSTLQC